MALGVLTTLLAGALVAVALVPPSLPRYEAFAASASGAPAAAMSAPAGSTSA
ncbi:MAG: hypothetical protein V9E87_02905 [Gemmatimonadales bacterium]